MIHEVGHVCSGLHFDGGVTLFGPSDYGPNDYNELTRVRMINFFSNSTCIHTDAPPIPNPTPSSEPSCNALFTYNYTGSHVDGVVEFQNTSTSTSPLTNVTWQTFSNSAQVISSSTNSYTYDTNGTPQDPLRTQLTITANGCTDKFNVRVPTYFADYGGYCATRYVGNSRYINKVTIGDFVKQSGRGGSSYLDYTSDIINIECWRRLFCRFKKRRRL